MSSDLLETLRRVPAIGIIRGCPPEHIEAVAREGVDAGFAVLEVTLDSPEPYRSLDLLTLGGGGGAVIGVGTVRTAAEVDAAADGGARFIVSPLLDNAVIAAAVRRDLPVLPGAATPTEVWSAVQAGATAVKIFPAAELGGPEYLRAIGGPLGNPRLVPTGGVTAENAPRFLDAGAFALGVGGSVFSADAMRTGDAAQVGAAAASFIGAIR